MKPGNLIEFTSGLFGIQPPENLGFVIERSTKKKVVFLKILTTKGIKEVRAHQITKRKLNLNVNLNRSLKFKELENELLPRLKDSIKRFGSPNTISKKRSTTIVQKINDTDDREQPSTEQDFWMQITKYMENQKLFYDNSFSIQQLASIWFKVESPSFDQYNSIEELIKNSYSPGVGYFDLKEKNKWNPLHPNDYPKILDDIKSLEKLRNKLVETEDYEDEEGYTQTRHIPVGVKYAGLTSEEEELLKNVQTWMGDLIQHGRLGYGTGLGKTRVHQIDKFALSQYLRFLAEDWTETRNLLQPASAMTEFLFRTNFWSETEALEAIAKRAIEHDDTFTWEVDPEMEELATSFPEPIDTPEILEKRKDLTSLLAYTVDPEGARDFDQALSFEKTENGYILWVHIAEVSHYVTRGSKLDDYAKQRATAVYLPSRGLPMNPPALSTGLCALQANAIRLSLSVKLEFSKEGLRQKTEFYEAYINVKDNLTYDYVDEQLEQKDSYWTGMLELGNILRKRFRGLNVETTETKMSTQNPLLEVAVSESSVSSEMNEMFMVAANEAVGEKLRDSGLPAAIYRCHPLPDKPDVEKFNDQMKALGLEVEVELPKILEEKTALGDGKNGKKENKAEENVLDLLKTGGKLSLGGGGFMATKPKKLKKNQTIEKKEKETLKEEEEKNKVVPTLLYRGLANLSPSDQEAWMKPFREVLLQVKKVKDPIIQKVMHLTVLGMFGRAYYTKDNIGHFGLGSTCYTHFTAPIRRYSDIIAHRILKSVLRGTESENPEYSDEELEELTEYCSNQSQKAEKIEFQIKGAGLVLMTRRPEWSGNLSAVVVKVMARGIFLLIREIVEGRINMRDLTKDEIIVDPSESIAFRKRREDAQIKLILTSKDWQDMLDEDDEPIEILARLGQFINVKITGRDYVEGKVQLVPSE
jgi:exoribonuclease R